MLSHPLGHPHTLGVLEHSRSKKGGHTKEPMVSQWSKSRDIDVDFCYSERKCAPSGAGARELAVIQAVVTGVWLEM